MKHLVIFILIIASTLFAQQPVGQPQNKWKLFLCDEFNGVTLDPSWIVDSGPWSQGYTSPKNVEITKINNNGYLVIKSFLDSAGNKSSGRIRFSKQFRYGFFEVKCSYNSSIWPCVWLMPRTDMDMTNVDLDEAKTAGAEIDIIESFGTYPSTATQQNIIYHYTPLKSEKRQVSAKKMSSLWQQYGLPPEFPNQVVFSIEWTPEYYVFFINGDRSGDTIFTHVSHIPEDLIISSEPGSTPRSVTYSQKPQKFMVDYIRVWNQISGYPEPEAKAALTIINNYILH